MSVSSDAPLAAIEGPTAAIRYVVVDCLDLDRSAGFWGPLLGLAPERRLDNYLFMGSALPGCDLVLQLVDRVTAEKNAIHFDIQGSKTGDFDKIVARAERLGGTIKETINEHDYSLVVMTDPDGNEFCVNRVPSGRPVV